MEANMTQVRKLHKWKDRGPKYHAWLDGRGVPLAEDYGESVRMLAERHPDIIPAHSDEDAQRWRLFTKIQFSRNGCWLWTGTDDGNGYGLLSVYDKLARAHRAVYQELVGPIPEGLELDHLCRNPSCVNPAHLEPVTAQENIRRSAAFRDRLATVAGQEVLGPKLRALRLAAGLTKTELARRIGVSDDTIRRWELGHNRLPWEAVPKLAAALNVNPDIFYDRQP
jgi:DNA-binding XRE family transcriptional regulator